MTSEKLDKEKQYDVLERIAGIQLDIGELEQGSKTLDRAFQLNVKWDEKEEEENIEHAI